MAFPPTTTYNNLPGAMVRTRMGSRDRGFDSRHGSLLLITSIWLEVGLEASAVASSQLISKDALPSDLAFRGDAG